MKKINTLLIALSLSVNAIMAQSPLNSLDFDGVDDYVSSALPAVFSDISNNNITMEAWIKPSAINFSRVIFAQFDATNFASISLSSANEIYFYVGNVTGEKTIASLPVGTWSHVACTWNASTSSSEIYINGILETTGTGGSSTLGTDNLMTIGAKTNAAQFFTGELDEVRIWDVVRTSCEINNGMNAEFTISQPNLVAYYNFNQGVAGGTNAGITTLPDFTTNYDGTLTNFGLAGATSNWTNSGASINSVNSATDLTTSMSGTTITANNASATYQWLACDNNYSIISGETGQTYTATTNGNYAVELTKNGCIDTTACVNISSVGMFENSFGNDFAVYPNPTTGSFSIDLGANNDSGQIKITDINGRLVNTLAFNNSSKLNLNLEEPAGIYFLTITSLDKTAVIKLVKK